MFEVGNPWIDLALGGLVVVLVIILIGSLWPWRLRGGRNRWTLLLPFVAIACYAVYELLMPDRFDIRIDLMVIVPVIGLIVLAGAVRVLLLLLARGRS